MPAAQPELRHCYLEDQARPIGSGWRWLFVKKGTKKVIVLDPWNRYTVWLNLAPRGGREDDGHKTWASVDERVGAPPAAMLKRAKTALRRRIIESGEQATAYETECLMVT